MSSKGIQILSGFFDLSKLYSTNFSGPGMGLPMDPNFTFCPGEFPKSAVVSV